MGFDRVIVCSIVFGVFDKMLPKWYWAICKSCQNSIGHFFMIGSINSLVRVWLVLSLNFDKMLPKWYWAFCKSCQNSIGLLVMIGNIISLVRVWLVLSLNFVFLCLIVDYLFN